MLQKTNSLDYGLGIGKVFHRHSGGNRPYAKVECLLLTIQVRSDQKTKKQDAYFLSHKYVVEYSSALQFRT